MSASELQPQQNVVSNLFHGGEQQHDMPVMVSHLPQLVLPIAHFIHEHRPTAIIANDRGARLAGLAIYKTYHALYDEPLPTHDHKLHFAYISKTQTSSAGVVRRLGRILGSDQSRTGARVLFVDDWITTGATVGRFVDAAAQVGVPSEQVAIATLCGQTIPGLTHVVGSTRTTINSEWNAYEEIIGIEVADANASLTRSSPNQYASEARQRLNAAIFNPEKLAS